MHSIWLYAIALLIVSAVLLTGNQQRPDRTFRLSDEFMASVDSWAACQEDQPGRSEAIRRLVEIGLRAGASAEDSGRRTKLQTTQQWRASSRMSSA
jgi:hypothetical protein